jgi:hypothetical protein
MPSLSDHFFVENEDDNHLRDTNENQEKSPFRGRSVSAKGIE